jgi:hypothetical protein
MNPKKILGILLQLWFNTCKNFLKNLSVNGNVILSRVKKTMSNFHFRHLESFNAENVFFPANNGTFKNHLKATYTQILSHSRVYVLETERLGKQTKTLTLLGVSNTIKRSPFQVLFSPSLASGCCFFFFLLWHTHGCTSIYIYFTRAPIVQW